MTAKKNVRTKPSKKITNFSDTQYMLSDESRMLRWEDTSIFECSSLKDAEEKLFENPEEFAGMAIWQVDIKMVKKLEKKFVDVK